MTSTGTPPAAITPQGVRDGDPAVLAALAARRGPAVMAFAQAVCEPRDVVRAAADAFARFRALVADPEADVAVHPDALLLRCARRAALDLAPRGPDLGCGPAADLLVARAERTINARDSALLNRHLESCEHCTDISRRLDAADRAYREAEDTPLEPAMVAPMVAALAAAAPVRMPAPAEPIVLDEARIATSGQHDPPPEPEPAPEPEAVEEPEPEPVEEPAPEPEAVAEPEPEPDPEEAPLGTRRLTGAPASYYELPPLPARERGRRAKAAARGAVAAASLTRRAGAAARKRLERPTPAPVPLDPEPEPAGDAEDTRIWNRVDSIEFPAQEAVAPEPAADVAPAAEPELYDPELTADPELEETAARAAARHYRRLRHKRQTREVVPSDGRPPRLERPQRDRGQHLPLSAHGPRDLALPAGLVVVAVLVIMAVSGVFGGGSETPSTGTSAAAPAEVSLVSQSPTSMSLADAERIAARAGSTTP